MKKAIAFLVLLALMLIPATPGVAHDDPDTQRGIVQALLFPFQLAIAVLVMPVNLVKEVLEKQPEEKKPEMPEKK